MTAGGGTAERRAFWLMAAPLVLLLAGLYLLPLLNVALLSVTDPKPGLAAWATVGSSNAVRKVALTTLRVGGIVTPLAVLIGYVTALAITLAGPRQKALLVFGVLVPLWMPVLVRAYAWVTLLRSEGLINSGLQNAGIIGEPLMLMNNDFGVIVAMTHFMVPYAVLPLLAVMAGIEPQLLRAARGLGATPVQAFVKVFLPLTKPGIFAALVLVFILTLGFFVTPVILGGGRTVMVAEYVTVQIQQTLRWGVAAALSVAILGLTLALVALLSRSMNLKKALGA